MSTVHIRPRSELDQRFMGGRIEVFSQTGSHRSEQLEIKIYFLDIPGTLTSDEWRSGSLNRRHQVVKNCLLGLGDSHFGSQLGSPFDFPLELKHTLTFPVTRSTFHEMPTSHRHVRTMCNCSPIHLLVY